MEVHVASKVIIKHPESDEILLIKRSMDPTAGFEAAGGRVEIDFKNRTAENLEQCIVRETAEELGLQIETLRYIGSYYFFWSIKENACSICAVFLATVSSVNNMKKQSVDACGTIYPIWVKIDDILIDQISIEKQHVGLSKIINDVAQDIMSKIEIKRSWLLTSS
jgi:ADP-ribose pyrophosphatase YjhB (NUDIX family)